MVLQASPTSPAARRVPTSYAEVCWVPSSLSATRTWTRRRTEVQLQVTSTSLLLLLEPSFKIPACGRWRFQLQRTRLSDVLILFVCSWVGGEDCHWGILKTQPHWEKMLPSPQARCSPVLYLLWSVFFFFLMYESSRFSDKGSDARRDFSSLLLTDFSKCHFLWFWIITLLTTTFRFPLIWMSALLLLVSSCSSQVGVDLFSKKVKKPTEACRWNVFFFYMIIVISINNNITGGILFCEHFEWVQGSSAAGTNAHSCIFMSLFNWRARVGEREWASERRACLRLGVTCAAFRSMYGDAHGARLSSCRFASVLH